jgi:hypothetical protein
MPPAAGRVNAGPRGWRAKGPGAPLRNARPSHLVAGRPKGGKAARQARPPYRRPPGASTAAAAGAGRQGAGAAAGEGLGRGEGRLRPAPPAPTVTTAPAPRGGSDNCGVTPRVVIIPASQRVEVHSRRRVGHQRAVPAEVSGFARAGACRRLVSVCPLPAPRGPLALPGGAGGPRGRGEACGATGEGLGRRQGGVKFFVVSTTSPLASTWPASISFRSASSMTTSP